MIILSIVLLWFHVPTKHRKRLCAHPVIGPTLSTAVRCLSGAQPAHRHEISREMHGNENGTIPRGVTLPHRYLADRSAAPAMGLLITIKEITISKSWISKVKRWIKGLRAKQPAYSFKPRIRLLHVLTRILTVSLLKFKRTQFSPKY